MRYGARLTHRWKGRLLTALATAGLLVASAGAALAQNTGVTITGPSMNTVAEGGTATYTVTVRGYVDAAADANTPTATNTVTVSLATPTPAAQTGTTDGEATDLDANAFINRDSVTFNTPANASTSSPLLFTGSQTITVATLHDDDAENEGFTLAFTLDAAGGLDQGADNDTEIALGTGTAAPPGVLIIDDDETQTYTLSIPANARPSEGDALTVTGRAVPAHVQGSSGALTLYTDPSGGYTLSANTITIGTAAGTVDITQTADRNRSPDTVTLSAYMETPGPGADTLVASLSITFADDNALPAVEVEVTTAGGTPLDPQPMSVAEGASVHVRATAVDRDGDPAAFAEQLTIKLGASASGTADARDIVAPGDLTIPANGNPSNVVELTIFGPDDDVGMETLVLDAVVSGTAALGTETSTSSAVLTLDITDETDPLIWALPEDEAYPKITNAIDAGDGADDVLNPYPQESFTVDMSGLFGVAMGYRGSYTATVDSTAVSLTSTGTMLTVTADHEGEAKVTITGTAARASSSAFSSDQSIANVASITFDVAVEDSELTVTVAAVPDAIDEGGTSEITATANRMVTAADGAVAIDLLVVGDATLDADSITIAQGSDSGSATLTAAADDDTNNETVTVIASGSGITGNMQVEVAVNDTTEVPEPPAPTNGIEAKSADEAYSAITDPLNAAAGDDGLNPGESFSVMASALFTVMEGYTASYSAAASDDTVSVSTSGDTVTVVAEAAGEATVTVTGTATSAGSSFEGNQVATNVATVTFPVTVVNKPPAPLVVTVTASASEVDEGDSVTLTAEANRAVTADTVLNVTVTGDMAAVSAPASFTISSGDTEATATVEAVEDDDTANANVTLVVSGGGIATPVSFSLAVTDNDRTVNMRTQAEVDAVFAVAVARAAGGDMWLPGGNAATVDMSELFTTEAGATVEYEAMSSDDDTVAASASGSMLTLNPEATGAATITVTATDTSGDAYDTATVSSMVSVGVLPLVITLELPANVNPGRGDVVEGSSHDIVVSANRAVHADTVVTIMRDRAASDADDSDYTVGSATLMAGSDSATATLMVTADDLSEGATDDGGNVGETLVLFGVVNGEQTNDLTFTIWDVAVPALPFIATWLLGLGLLGGGARQLYLRRRQD